MNNKYIRRMEKTTANAVYRALRSDLHEIQAYLRAFDGKAIIDTENKSLVSILEVWLKGIGGRVVNAFVPRAKETLTRGVTDAGRRYKDKGVDFAVDFRVLTRPEAVYIRAIQDLHLSSMNGSISETTRQAVIQTVAKGTVDGKTYSQIADELEELHAFGRNRAELIAINQVGKAYQFGEYEQMLELYNAGYLVLKYWSTVNDGRVTPTHTQNQNMGWVDLKEDYGATGGDQIPPASDNPRCRCAEDYKVGDLRGGPQNEEMQQIMAASENSKNTREYLSNIEQNYSTDNDYIMNRALNNFGGAPEDIFMISSAGFTKENAVALHWWKTEQYYNMNYAIRNRIGATEYNGMILELNNALDKMPTVQGTVWRGISGDKVEELANLTPGSILSDNGFMSTSKSRDVAERFNGGAMMNIRSKTGRNLGDMDFSSEQEVLFRPGSNLIFDKYEDGVYFFTEL